MPRVYKFPAKMTGGRRSVAATVPHCLKVVLFGPQGADGLFVWAEVHETRGVEERFLVLATGDDVPDDCVHEASCQDGPYVWHLYREWWGRP